MVGEAVRALVSELPEGRRLRVLEVGAGTGGTTARVLPALPAGRTDYAYTDVSAGFFAEAEGRFGGFPGIEYRVLDIERDPVSQGFAPHGYDVVLAANVLHTTRDVSESLGHCRRLLSASGVLVALEGAERQGFLDLTFGLLPGWWRFADGVRVDHPLLPAAAWRAALGDAGCSEVEVLEAGLGQVLLLGRGPEAVGEEPGLWVLSPGAGGGELASALSGELSDRGQTVLVGEGSDRERWRGLFAELPPDPPLRGVVHLGGLGGGEEPGAELPAAVEESALGALALLQGLHDAGRAPGAGLWLVTRGGQVFAGDPPAGLAGSALWGLGKVAARELPDLGVRLVDLDPGSGAAASDLVRELLFPDVEGEAAWRGGERLVPRLRRRPAGSGEGGPRLRGDRSYLVTGGLGGIGLEVAGWLHELGAGAVVLNGRREPGEAASAALRELESRGAEVRVELADVTDGAAVEGMVRRIGESDLPPLGGVIHGAGTLADASLANQGREGFLRVLRPKVWGAWHLHRATLGLELELFVLFSSVSGVLGNPGQSNHAAANAFLDQLARWRRERGLAGQAIAWGAWSGVGEAEEHRERIAAAAPDTAVGPLTPAGAGPAFRRLLAEGDVDAVVAPVDPALLDSGASPLLARVSRPPAERGQPAPGQLPARLREAGFAERAALLVEFLAEEVQTALRLGSPPSPDVGFFELGMDSLMAVELRNRVNRALGGEVEASNTAIFDYPSVAGLADHLAQEFEGRAPVRVAWSPRLEEGPGRERIAVVGMACRFPGGPDPASFWSRLARGEHLVTPARPDGLMVEGGGDTPVWGRTSPNWTASTPRSSASRHWRRS